MVAEILESTSFHQLQTEPAFVRKAFPELNWLKSHANAGSHWPSLIMNATASSNWRPDIRGPLTLFVNLSGTSYVTVEGYRAPITEQLCLISNAGQYYSLEIDSPQPVETFNLHIGDLLLKQTLESLVLPPEQWLDGGERQRPFYFPNRLEPCDQVLQRWMQRVRQLEATQTGNVELDSAMHDLLLWLLQQQSEIQTEINRLPALRQSTRTELYLRLNRARDCLLATHELLDLDSLAQAACLSKYHFLRLFKSAYGCTPHQFQLRLRMEKARRLLARTPMTIQAIAWQLGFEEVSSFSRQFHRQIGVYPSQYRQQAG